ncbi:hypothetical protein MN210_03575 [Psychrobacter raelei]|uniref:Fimbrial biogenesis outer membrane usher protein n=1 Tax=Psychrobacter raelei TaxID=2565531 RepID=A0AAT9PFQ0_9GAMM
MITKPTTLRLMILASLPGLWGTYGIAGAAINIPHHTNAEPMTTAAEATGQEIKSNPQNLSLTPSLVGIYVNDQEVDTIEVLVNSDAQALPTQTGDSGEKQNNHHYYLSLADLTRLTGIQLTANGSVGSNSNTGYQVSTPIGDTQLTANTLTQYQSQDYIALSTLKKLGITADYMPADLAVRLNMGWQPKKEGVALAASETLSKSEQQAVDYRPGTLGLLGLSFNSSLSVSENPLTSQQSSTNRQMYADIGAFGYAFGGVWGARALGVDSDSDSIGRWDNTERWDDEQRIRSERFSQTALDGFTYLPSEWDDWQIDNLYWAKSGQQLATRIGVSQPNSLGQGAQTSGSEFTGALIAYSNRDIERHLAFFDDTSSSLLQNTSQDYQHITGIGEPGGVAELRIDGRALAQVQIGLDGRYEFLNLDVSQLTLADTLVEIAIFAYPLARQPLEVRPIFLGKRRTNTATDELLIEAGIGRSGNLFNSDSNDNHDTAAHVYAEYGISNRLAVRAGANTNLQNDTKNSDELSWHTGVNYSPSVYTNADLSYAHTPTQELWQAQLQYQRDKLWANYQYNYREFEGIGRGNSGSNTDVLRDKRHQLLLNYRPNDKTIIGLNQYYDDLDQPLSGWDKYHAYASIYHQFSQALNADVNWDTRGDRYNYRVNWQDINLNRRPNNNSSTRNRVGLSGTNDSDTLSLRHYLNDRISLGQSVSRHHEHSEPLYQGDISYRFYKGGADPNLASRFSGFDNLVSVGYSLYDNKVGWQADWQLTHHNSINFSLGYKHRYVDAIATENLDGLITTDGFIIDNALPAWRQNNYLYAKLSFDMFKPPKQGLKMGNFPRQNLGSVVVDVAHPAEPAIHSDSMSFTLDNQKVVANLLGSKDNHSQYLISNIKAGDYTLKMDAEELPLEYSTQELPTPRIRVSNYAPTSVPIQLHKTYGVSGQLADAKTGVEIGIYQNGEQVQSVRSGSYGYFQAFGLAEGHYTLQADGYQAYPFDITNDFVMQLILQPAD